MKRLVWPPRRFERRWNGGVGRLCLWTCCFVYDVDDDVLALSFGFDGRPIIVNCDFAVFLMADGGADSLSLLLLCVCVRFSCLLACCVCACVHCVCRE